MQFEQATRIENGIDCYYNHPHFGWIPITLRPSDPDTSDMYAIVDSWLKLNEPSS